MFGKKKETKRQPRPLESLEQYGIFEVPDNLNDDFMGNNENDDDLEAELAALTASGDADHRHKRNEHKLMSNVNLDAMVAESMKDVNPDEEVSDGEDDPELLSELEGIIGDESSSLEDKIPPPCKENLESSSAEDRDTSYQPMITMLEERLKMYQIADVKAKVENETGRSRRYNRGIKTLKELLSHLHAGEMIDERNIPPVLPPSATAESTGHSTNDVNEVYDGDAPAAVSNDTISESTTVIAVDQTALELLKKRQQEYKIAAVAWKKAGNMGEAIQCIKIVKQFDTVIAAMSAGETIDLSDMPPSPSGPTSTVISETKSPLEKEESEFQTAAVTKISPAAEESPSYYGSENIESALKERLEVYRRSRTAAETEGNSSKARRYGRICKQFEDALKLYTRGKPVPLDELPVPPGFPPLSVDSSGAVPTEASEGESHSTPNTVTTSPENDNTKLSPHKKPSIPASQSNIGRKQNQKTTSRAEKQMMQLQQRQHVLKQAALRAKSDGDLELARDYLRQAMGIQPLIEASKAGLPVDMNSIPLSPLAKMELDEHGLSSQGSDNFTLISAQDCTEEASGTDQQIYDNLEAQLAKQKKWCLSTRDHSKALGDVPGYNRWERLALGYSRDLDMLRVRKRDALPPPQHHYETKTYAIVQSCTDLNDSDVEISIIRGINYPKEADTYVMFEFPYPTDSPPADRTSTVKASTNPEYQAVFPLNGIIDRNSRQCQRSFKRHALKCQIWAKGGFFRSDNLLGTVTVKLQPLETQCVLHDSFPLMEGRKPTGGKLELKVRLRNPILTKQIEQITDKWLTIDH